MKVREEDCAENVAFRKPTEQSSTWWKYIASIAVDGDVNTATSTNQGSSPHWWKVNFQGIKVIDEIKIRIRMRPYATTYDVVMSNTTDFQESKHCYTIRNNYGQNSPRNVEFRCVDGITIAKSMRVDLVDFNALSIEEVTVFGWNGQS